MSRGKGISKSPLKSAGRLARAELPTHLPKAFEYIVRPDAPFVAALSKDQTEVAFKITLTPKEYMHVLKMIFLKRQEYPQALSQGLEACYQILEAAQAQYPLNTLADFKKLPKLVTTNQVLEIKCKLPPQDYTTQNGTSFKGGATGGSLREIYQGLKYYKENIKQVNVLKDVEKIEKTFVECLTPLASLFKTEVIKDQYGHDAFRVNGTDSMLIAKAIYPLFENDPNVKKKHFTSSGQENGRMLWSLNQSVLMSIGSQFDPERLDEIAANTVVYYEGRNQVSIGAYNATVGGVLDAVETALRTPALADRLSNAEKIRLAWLANFFQSLGKTSWP